MCYDVKRHKHMPSIVLLSFIIVVNATFAGVTGKIAAGQKFSQLLIQELKPMFVLCFFNWVHKTILNLHLKWQD